MYDMLGHLGEESSGDKDAGSGVRDGGALE